MTEILVLYYSSFGHVEKLAEAIAEGAAQRRRHDLRWRRIAPQPTAVDLAGARHRGERVARTAAKLHSSGQPTEGELHSSIQRYVPTGGAMATCARRSRRAYRYCLSCAIKARPAGPGGASLRKTTLIGIAISRGKPCTRIFASGRLLKFRVLWRKDRDQ